MPSIDLVNLDSFRFVSRFQFLAVFLAGYLPTVKAEKKRGDG
ncbi:MAG: hypothetical protein ACI84K_001361 [Pseudohongiellaceae bacterium]|jgi:hypothetical protein